MSYERHEKTLLIRPEFLNHSGTAFGGYMMKWADDMAFNAASLTFPGASFVTKLFGQIDFIKPVQAGDIIKVCGQVESKGTTSCKVKVWACNGFTNEKVFDTFAIMVNVKNGQKAPLPADSSGEPVPTLKDQVAVSAMLDRN
ncbi:MAG TPA: acyl-CoA thioesterase [Chthoniobacteraceae bacterium]|nr:acyl-CoA thioesterase [Chthoniobacteraceae bacterium]